MVKTKVCSKCKKRKPLTKFSMQTAGKLGRHTYCALCMQQYYKNNREVILKKRKQYYADNKEAALKYGKQTQKNYRQNWLLFINAKALACQTCGYSTSFSALDFHHADPKQKDFKISRFFTHACNAKNQAILMKELKKCRVLCCRCHRELHEFLNQQK